MIIYGCGSNTEPWTIAKAATHVFALFYAPLHPMFVQGGATVWGGVVAKSLTVRSQGAFIQDEALGGGDGAPARIEYRAWSQAF